jgi:hypothetical protein
MHTVTAGEHDGKSEPIRVADVWTLRFGVSATDTECRFQCPPTKRHCDESERHIFLRVCPRAAAEPASHVLFEFGDRRKAA